MTLFEAFLLANGLEAEGWIITQMIRSTIPGAGFVVDAYRPGGIHGNEHCSWRDYDAWVCTQAEHVQSVNRIRRREASEANGGTAE